MADGLPRLPVRQVDEEDFVEAALADELGREAGDVVGGGDHEDVTATVLQPGEEGAEDPPGDAAVLLAPGGGKRLLDLVDPEDDRSHALRGAERALEVLLAVADVLVVEQAGVEAQQGEGPLIRDRLGAEALPASGDPQEEDTLGEGEAEAAPALAGSARSSWRFRSQPLRPARSAMSSMRSSTGKYSSRPSRSTMARLASMTSPMSSIVRRPSSMTGPG